MLFCYKCGKKLSESDKYCLKCGARVFNPEDIEILLSKTDEITAKTDNAVSEEAKEKTAAALPKKKKTKAEAFMQLMTILFAVFALIIVTVVGSMLISSNLKKNGFDTGSEDANTSSMNDSAASTDNMSSNSTTVTQTTAATKQTQKNGLIVYDKAEMKKKIVGTWNTEIEYKSMTVPGTIKFFSSGKCSLSVSALFISKKFEGTYTVGDNGRCVMNLPGLEEFIENKNTISGKASFYNDNKVKFVTDGGNVITLTRS